LSESLSLNLLLTLTLAARDGTQDILYFNPTTSQLTTKDGSAAVFLDDLQRAARKNYQYDNHVCVIDLIGESGTFEYWHTNTPFKVALTYKAGDDIAGKLAYQLLSGKAVKSQSIMAKLQTFVNALVQEQQCPMNWNNEHEVERAFELGFFIAAIFLLTGKLIVAID
jgi:hypothetical protein